MTTDESMVVNVMPASAVAVGSSPFTPSNVQITLLNESGLPLAVAFLDVVAAKEMAGNIVAACLKIESDATPVDPEIRKKML